MNGDDLLLQLVEFVAGLVQIDIWIGLSEVSLYLNHFLVSFHVHEEQLLHFQFKALVQQNPQLSCLRNVDFEPVSSFIDGKDILIASVGFQYVVVIDGENHFYQPGIDTLGKLDDENSMLDLGKDFNLLHLVDDLLNSVLDRQGQEGRVRVQRYVVVGHEVKLWLWVEVLYMLDVDSESLHLAHLQLVDGEVVELFTLLLQLYYFGDKRLHHFETVLRSDSDMQHAFLLALDFDEDVFEDNDVVLLLQSLFVCVFEGRHTLTLHDSFILELKRTVRH